MIVEVAGVSTNNKGAELMLVAVRDHFAAHFPDVRLVVDPWFGPYEDRAKYGLRTKLAPTKLGRSALAMWLMPKSFRDAYGLVAEREIDAVLDASGFAFGDQLGSERSERMSQDVNRWKRHGKQVILLPQAFGPFETSRVRQAFVKVLNCADLVFARDKASHDHLARLLPAAPNLRLAPDFTNLVQGTLPEGLEPPRRMACVVPNHRMLEKPAADEQASYIPFLATCIEELRRCELTPCLLLHDARVDDALVEPIQASLQAPIQVLGARDPRCLKGILGRAHLVIGSRFHALVGALSQSVPCIGVGWSHKYQTLFEDHGCSDLVLPVSASLDRVCEAISSTIEEPARASLIARLQTSARLQMRCAKEMWCEVDTLLGIPNRFESKRPQPYIQEQATLAPA